MRKWFPWLLVGLAFGFSAAVYTKLPAEIPTHWGFRGEINDHTSRVWAAWLMPLVLTAMAIVLPRLPAIDPRRGNYEKFRPSYDLVIDATMAVIAGIHVATLGASLGWPVPIAQVTPIMVGVLFVTLGNVLPRARSNWVFGIRTPWTLSNDRVWERTHRLGGMTFVGAGLALIVSAFLRPTAMVAVLVVASVIAGVIPVVYSYFAWRQETSRVEPT
jgi:uncharacterized membrane protein